MLEYKNNTTIESLIPPSDCEQHYLPKWIKNSTGNFYIGDSFELRQSIEKFITGSHRCKIDFDSYSKYYVKVKQVLNKFGHLFKGPLDQIDKYYSYFKNIDEKERYFDISYNAGERYLKTSKSNHGVREYKGSLVANITFIKIIKDKNGEYTIFTYLDKNWRENLMSKYSKFDLEAIRPIFNEFISNKSSGKTEFDMARLFGIKYAPLIKSNNIDIDNLVSSSNYNSAEILNCVKNGMLLSSDILWDKFEDDDGPQNFNVYGMHITQENAAIENGYVCIGWSLLGDLSSINTKDELIKLYTLKYPDHSPQKRGACVGQIWMFKNTMQIGDYVVFFDKGTAHIGKVIGEYEYLTDISNQNPDYTNNRKVEWIKEIKYSDLLEEYRKSALTQRSIFTLNSYKGLISDILKGKDILVDEGDGYEDETIDDSATLPIFDYSSSTITDGQNLIVYGTPGCGKSYYVQNILLNDCPNYIRTTFYQDYTNTDFVGQILPKVDGDRVTYEFNPGPFTLALELAIRKPNEHVALVIEELNRGSAASIFGDLFQLLDRKNGVSEYAILNVNILEYLRKQFKGQYNFNEIKLPGNLSIFATMNTSDQNVFTLDTAFKRRWKFKKLLNKFNANHRFKDKYIPGANITWEYLVTSINEYILEVGEGLNSEDKQLGVYFVDEKGMRQETVNKSSPEEIDDFAYKVLEYLWDDVAKFGRNKWFDSDIKSLDELVEEYKKRGLEVFAHDIFDK